MKAKIIIIGILFLISISCVSAALNTELQPPTEFEKANNWDKAVYDIYSLKTDNNTELYITEYTDKDYDLFFKDDTTNGYYVNPLDNNMLMGKDNDFNDGYVFEIIEYNGEKYIVYTYLMDNPTNDQIKDSSKYLTEFNEINKVTPITI